MAKRKRSAALFEVFHDSKSALAAGGGHYPSRGWFKPRAAAPSGGVATAHDPNDPTSGATRSSLVAPRIAAVEAIEPPATGAPASVELPRLRVPASLAQPNSHFQIDPCTRQVTMTMPFTIAIVSAFVVVIAIALAYVLGHHSGAAATPGTADQAADDSTRAILPSALEVPRRAIAGQGQQAKPTAAHNSDDSRSHDHDMAPKANGTGHITINNSNDVDVDGNRIIGLNYVLIKVYPSQAGAAEARDFLLRNGIGCTIEKVPEGFYCPDPTWLAVITTRGFDRDQLHSAEYNEFKTKIERLSDSFSAKNKNKQFSLQPYKLK